MMNIEVKTWNPEMGIRPEGESQGQRIESEIISPRDFDTQMWVNRYAELTGM